MPKNSIISAYINVLCAHPDKKNKTCQWKTNLISIYNIKPNNWIIPIKKSLMHTIIPSQKSDYAPAKSDVIRWLLPFCETQLEVLCTLP